MPPTVESAPPHAAAAPAVNAASAPTVYPTEAHTCAPWEIEDDGVSSGKLIRIIHVEHDADDEGRHVAYVTHVADVGDCQEEAANARLIAAAPAMLAALRELHDAALMVESIVHGYAAAAMAADLSRKMAAARAVVAAAEGRS